MKTAQGTFVAFSAPIFLLMVLFAPTMSNAEVQCPEDETITPCTCDSSPAGLVLHCTDKCPPKTDESPYVPCLNDDAMIELHAQNTEITTIPVEISQFPSISWFDLDFNSYLTSIPTGAFQSEASLENVKISMAMSGITSILPNAFNFPNAKSVDVIFTGNSISSIAPDAFQAMGTVTTSINFIFTQLKKLEENVFKPILQKMNTGSKLYIGGNHDIDCGCDLAWLIRDNSDLLEFIVGGTCSDKSSMSEISGKSFDELMESDFVKCK